MNMPGPSDAEESRSGGGELGFNLAGTLRGHHGLRHTSSGQISSCVASQLHMLSILGLIPTAHTIVGTGGTVL